VAVLVPTAPPANLGPGALPVPAPTVSTATADAARLATIAEEIRRRRALRQQAMQGGTPPSPSPPNRP